jgi:ribonuclease HII
MYERNKFNNLPKSPTLEFENKHWVQFSSIAGLDEAGRGAWAGPVSAAAVILPQITTLTQTLNGVKDSKLMLPKERDFWASVIKTVAITWGIGFSTASEIDEMGIIAATRLAMQRALLQMNPQPQFLLIDALTLPAVKLPQEALIKGDQRCLSIAAASVLAKTARDAHMCTQDQLYPNFGFSSHKGYGTKRHQLALTTNGPSPIHRKSFKPIQTLNTIYPK